MADEFLTPQAPRSRSSARTAEALALEQGVETAPDIEKLRQAILPAFETRSPREAATLTSALLDQATLEESDAIVRFVLSELVPLVRESELSATEHGWFSNSKGLGFMVLGEYERAARELTLAIDIARTQADLDLTGVALQNLSLLELRRGDTRQAEELRPPRISRS